MACLADTLRSAAARLGQALALDAPAARLEAQVLAGHALGVARTWLVAHDRDALTADEFQAIEGLVSRRERGEPVAYILGYREFYGRPFRVSPDVLIPRPETELLVEAALERLPRDQAVRALDLGTGSGCLAITLALECPAWQVRAVDRSPAALAEAEGNARTLGAQVRWLASDWFAALAGEAFDLIVANPPYVPDDARELGRGDVRFEPRGALAAGPAGLDALVRIVAAAPGHLAPGGWLLLEHGWDQGQACRDLLGAAGLIEVASLRDLAGHPRVSLGRQPE